jgi:translation initiation factor IF-3
MNLVRFLSSISDVRKATSSLSVCGCRALLRFSNRQYFIAGHASKCIQRPLRAQRLIHSSCFLFKESSDAGKYSDTIQLLGINGELRGVMKMRKAELLAKDEQLKLLRAEDKDAVHPVFRLVTTKDFNLEQKRLKTVNQVEKKKPAKKVELSSTISSHDLEIKVRQMLEWLEKGLEVKVLIKTGKSTEGENRVFDQVTTACKEHASIQSSKKTATELVFQLLPKSKLGADFEKKSADHDQKPLKLQELKKMQSTQESSKTVSALGDKVESTDRKK